MEANDAEAGQAIARHLSLGLGLLFLGSREAAEPIGEVRGPVAVAADGGAAGCARLHTTVQSLRSHAALIIFPCIHSNLCSN